LNKTVIGKEACTSKEPDGGGNFKVLDIDQIIFSQKLVLTPAIKNMVSEM
jgi:hypothetical protein